MAYVYTITNTINGKQYVGVTKFSLKRRFQEHCRSSRKGECKNRPLYIDMNKYGFDNFIIEELEECSNKDKFARECYWIEKLDTYNNGYNLTYGGSGKQFYDYKELADKYDELGSVNNVADFFGCDSHTATEACRKCGVDVLSTQELNKLTLSKPVQMCSKDGEFLNMFDSLQDAARYMIEYNLTGCKLSTIRTHISEVCRGKRNTAAGYKWRFCEENFENSDM